MRRDGLALGRAVVRVFEPIEVLAPRRDALLALYDAHLDGSLSAADLTGTSHDLTRAWAESAPDDVVSALPELAGPAGYLQWVWQGLETAHGQLADCVSGTARLSKVACQLLTQAKAEAVPAELALATGQDFSDEVSAQLGGEAAEYRPDAFTSNTLSWLSRALVAGQIDACRTWLDMAMRFIAAAKGLPGSAGYPLPCALPVTGFLRTVCEYSVRSSATNAVAARLTRTTLHDAALPMVRVSRMATGWIPSRPTSRRTP